MVVDKDGNNARGGQVFPRKKIADAWVNKLCEGSADCGYEARAVTV